MSTTENPQFIAHVQALVRKHGGVLNAWRAYREDFEYFDGETEIEAFYKARFFSAAAKGAK